MVTGVYMGSEGIINRKELAIPRCAVQVIDIDAWLISASDAIVPLAEIPDSAAFIQAGSLRGREVQTEGDTMMGVVEDVILDSQGQGLGFSLSKVYAKGPLEAKKAIDREAVTDLGGEEKTMTAILAQAESLSIPSVKRNPSHKNQTPPVRNLRRCLLILISLFCNCFLVLIIEHCK
jgi:uncharacterized protein YrrD